MSRSRVFGVLGALVVVTAALGGTAFTLRTVGPSAEWNVFAASTATPTPTFTPTPTSTSTPTVTPTPTATATFTPEPTATSSVPAPNPPSVPGPEVVGERWIDVDLSAQTTTAMIGETVLYTALVTTGKDGWETPPGTWRIEYRVANETMTSAAIGAEEFYHLTDVLYTQYFTNAGHALHLNYWREESYFGNERSSHGCVGMRLADAEFFWNFAGVGTRVVVR